MAAIRFTVTYLDDTKKEVRVSPKAQVMFERAYSTGMSKALKEPSAEHLYYLAWAGLHCAGMEARDFETFLAAISDVEAPDADAGEGEDEDPTRTGPGPDPSSN